MKRETYARYIRGLYTALTDCRGVIDLTWQDTIEPYLEIKRIDVFGSYVKGKEKPNDLDLIVECRAIGKTNWALWSHADFYGTYKYDTRKNGFESLYKMAGIYRKNAISVHSFDIDGDLAKDRLELYPRFDDRLLLRQPLEEFSDERVVL